MEFHSTFNQLQCRASCLNTLNSKTQNSSPAFFCSGFHQGRPCCEGAAVVGQNTNGKVVAFEGTAKAANFRLLEVTKIADEDEEDGPRTEVSLSYRISDN